MNKNINEVIECVEDLNYIYFETTGDEELLPFKFVNFTRSYNRIEYLGETIWDDQDNDRLYIENTEEYEPIMDFVKRKVKERNKHIIKFDGEIK